MKLLSLLELPLHNSEKTLRGSIKNTIHSRCYTEETFLLLGETDQQFPARSVTIMS
jgi:hypothetical protein